MKDKSVILMSNVHALVKLQGKCRERREAVSLLRVAYVSLENMLLLLFSS